MELRKDYILDRWVYVATERKKRPHEFVRKEDETKVDVCAFCKGSEHLTPPEIGRVGTKKNWTMRWFENKFPAVMPQGQSEIVTHNEFFTFSAAYGIHEVIVETNDHEKQIWDLSKKDLIQLIKIYRDRIDDLITKPNIKFVDIFKNHGKNAGTSLVHSHTQVVALNRKPQLIVDESNAAAKFDDCPYCKIINVEKGSDRRCFENDSWVAFTPYASRFNFEIWMFPKAHKTHLNQLEEHEFSDAADLLKQIVTKLKELNASFNFYLHYDEDLHLHFEIVPRFAVWAGFEFSSNDIINAVTPELAAQFYRGEAKD